MQCVFVRRLSWLARAERGRVMFLLAVAGVLLGTSGYLVTGQDGLALARLLPKGALACVQARDFRALLAQWRASSVRNRYYTSDSFRAFLQSRLCAKLNERIREFENGVGITLTEETVAAMAGTATAVALYDMGKIEFVFVTELSAKQAAATPLLARKAAFETRATAAGRSYLVCEVTTDGGRLRQALCVATPPGKLVVTTSEALMQRTLNNLDGNSDDCMLAAMAPTLASAQDFTPHDLTLWTDLSRLRQQPYFGYYWIHGAKAPGLEGVESVLADIEITREGLWERRWLLTSGRTAPAPFTPQQQPIVAGLLAASPFTTVETIPAEAGDIPAKAVIKMVFPPPPLPNVSNLPRVRVIEDTASRRAGRYQRLDERFDQDVDDPDAPSSDLSSRQVARAQSPDPLETELAGLFRSARPTLLARLSETTTEGSEPFVTFERALALYCQQPFEAKAYESVMGRAIAQRYFIAGTVPPVTWQTTPTGVVMPRAAALLERCGAYFVSGNLVVIASSVAYAERLKARLDGIGTKLVGRIPSNLAGTHRQVSLRLQALAPDCQRALRLIKPPVSQELKFLEGSSESIDFLGQNIASLLNVVDVFDVVTIESAAAGPVWFEQVRYRFQPPTGSE